MVRKTLINDKTLELFELMDKIEFPLDPFTLIPHLQNCRAMTYQLFSSINGCQLADIVALCDTYGSTHFDTVHSRHLILWNDYTDDNNTEARQRWTKAHELGHVVLSHLPKHSTQGHERVHPLAWCACEREANYLAAGLLAPLPLFDTLQVTSTPDAQRVFGISQEVATSQLHQYSAWLRGPRTTFDHNLLQTYLDRSKE